MKHITDNQSLPVGDRYDEIQSLVEEPALLIIGGPGSGKTEKLCWIMAYHCHQNHQVQLINPYAVSWRYKGLRVFGRDLNYAEAAQGLRKFIEEVGLRFHSRKTDPDYKPFHELHIHLGIDEIMNGCYPISQQDETIMQEFWNIDFRSLKQINMSVSIACQRDLHEIMIGEKTNKHDLTRLYCQSIKDPTVKQGFLSNTDTSVGRKSRAERYRKCSGWAEKITEENDRTVITRIKIPDWMIAPPDYNYEAIALYNL
jgi:hypothetical protein